MSIVLTNRVYSVNAQKINKPGIKSNDKIGKNLYYDYQMSTV